MCKCTAIVIFHCPSPRQGCLVWHIVAFKPCCSSWLLGLGTCHRLWYPGKAISTGLALVYFCLLHTWTAFGKEVPLLHSLQCVTHLYALGLNHWLLWGLRLWIWFAILWKANMHGGGHAFTFAVLEMNSSICLYLLFLKSFAFSYTALL